MHEVFLYWFLNSGFIEKLALVGLVWLMVDGLRYVYKKGSNKYKECKHRLQLKR